MNKNVLSSVNTRNLYQDCSDTTIDVWLSIMRTGDLKHLVKYGKAPKQEVLVAQMEKINTELNTLRKQGDALTNYDKVQYKRQLELRVLMCFQIYDMMTKRLQFGLLSAEHLEKYVARFKKLGFRINREKPLHEELEIIVAELQALQTTIRVLHIELYPDSDEEVTDEEKQIFQFHTMLLSFERILNIGTIDTSRTTLMRFAVIEQQVEMTIRQRNTNHN